MFCHWPCFDSVHFLLLCNVPFIWTIELNQMVKFLLVKTYINLMTTSFNKVINMTYFN